MKRDHFGNFQLTAAEAKEEAPLTRRLKNSTKTLIQNGVDCNGDQPRGGTNRCVILTFFFNPAVIFTCKILTCYLLFMSFQMLNKVRNKRLTLRNGFTLTIILSNC